MKACAHLIELGNPLMMEAIRESNAPAAAGDDVTLPNTMLDKEAAGVPRTFYVLFGLCIEALSTSAGTSVERTPTGRLEAERIILVCLQALNGLMQPAMLGDAFISDAEFREMISVTSRILQTESIGASIKVLELLSGVVTNYGKRFLSETDDTGLEKSPALTSIVKLLMIVFAENLPHLQASPRAIGKGIGIEQIDGAVDANNIYIVNARRLAAEDVQKLILVDLHACISLLDILPQTTQIDFLSSLLIVMNGMYLRLHFKISCVKLMR